MVRCNARNNKNLAVAQRAPRQRRSGEIRIIAFHEKLAYEPIDIHVQCTDALQSKESFSLLLSLCVSIVDAVKPCEVRLSLLYLPACLPPSSLAPSSSAQVAIYVVARIRNAALTVTHQSSLSPHSYIGKVRADSSSCLSMAINELR